MPASTSCAAASAARRFSLLLVRARCIDPGILWPQPGNSELRAGARMRLGDMAVAAQPQTDIDTALRQHDPDPDHRRGPEGQLRASGAVMGMAPAAYTLWQEFLRFDPQEPIWPNRDRFVLSNSRTSMLLYSLLHLTKSAGRRPRLRDPRRSLGGLEDIERFRQLDSKCPGHPEYQVDIGVRPTTGPLGQGIATSIGMAIAAKWLGAHFNRPKSSSSTSTCTRSAATRT